MIDRIAAFILTNPITANVLSVAVFVLILCLVPESYGQ